MSRLTSRLSGVTYVPKSDTTAGAIFPEWDDYFCPLRTTPYDPVVGLGD